VTEPARAAAGELFARLRRQLHEHHPEDEPAADQPLLDQQAILHDVAALQRQARLDRWALVCPPVHLDANLDYVAASHGQQVHDALAAWDQADPTPNLLLLGPIGAGKTSAGLAACRAGQLDRNVGLAFLKAPDLMDRLRPDGDPGLMARLVAAPRVMVDDLGTEKATDWTRERLDLLIDARWSAMLPLIVTTNLAPPDLAEHLGPRAYSRLIGGAVVLALTGHDRRRTP
jgi:DNA replication protein DnaC